MASKINSTAELPEWFDLRKYEPVSNFSAQDWLRELTFRTLALNQINFARESSASMSEEDKQILFDEAEPEQLDLVYDFSDLLNAMRSQPVRCQLEGNWFWDGLVEMTTLDGTIGRGCVQPLTMEHLYLLKNADEIDLEDGAGSEAAVDRWKYLTGEIHRDFEDEFPVIPIVINPRMPHRWEEPIVVVDLNAPDALLLDAFKDWLKDRRLSPPPGLTVRRKPAYEWWSRYGLLPYLDLLIWSHQTSIHIPDRVMAEAISSYNAGEDRLRKTIKPIIADLQSHLEGLQDLAAAELATDSSGNI